MPSRRWIALLCAWPGLAQIWSGQEVLGLILAGVFAFTVNTALAARFVWVEWVPTPWLTFLEVTAALQWLASCGFTFWWLWRFHPDTHRGDIDRLYREANDLYLKRRWDDARRTLEQLLAVDETDADALMLLGTLYARTDRPELARQSFRQCLDLDRGPKWRYEIDQALQSLARPST